MIPVPLIRIDPLLGLDASGVVPCMSPHGVPAHAAQWYAICPCGHSTPICGLRKQILFNEGGWRCSIIRGKGCTGWHPWEHVQFYLI